MKDRISLADGAHNIHLRGLIGRLARYQGEVYEILEILEDDPPSLVLQNCAHTTIQADQHGDAHRRVPEIVTLPLAFHKADVLDLPAMEIELLDTVEPAENASS
jgi:hypothetical protein